MSSYVGISSKARALSKVYVGVGGKAREVTKAYVGVSSKARLCYEGGRYIKDIAEGTTINVLESGTLTPFVVAKHNYESSLNGTGKHLLVRAKLLSDKRKMNTAYWDTDTNVRTWLSSTYASRLDASFKTHISKVTFYYRRHGSMKTLANQQYFIPSMYDADDWSQTVMNTIGAALGEGVKYALRDTNDVNPNNSDDEGDYYYCGSCITSSSRYLFLTYSSYSAYDTIRPCFCVDDTAQEAL